MSAVWNMTIVQGDNYELRIRLRSSDGTYVDLSGATVHSQIRHRPNGVLMAEFTTVLMDQGTTDGLGCVSLQLTAEQTASLRSNGVYDVQISWPSGTIQTCLAGQMLTKQDVTRVGS